MCDLSDQNLGGVRDAIDRLGEYLANERYSCSPIKFYLIPIGIGKPSSLIGKPTNWHRYIRRHTELDIIVSEHGSLFGSYFKIGPWICFALLKNEGQPWIGSEVTKTATKFMVGKSVFPPSMIDFLEDRAATAQKLLRGISNKQKKIIEESILKGDFENQGREMYDAIMADYEAFGSEAFSD